jgi:hypothetical protein
MEVYHDLAYFLAFNVLVSKRQFSRENRRRVIINASHSTDAAASVKTGLYS